MTYPTPVNDDQHRPPDGSREWWRQAVVYQVYPRSFADGDGDGIGDLPGLISRLPHLAALGVDALWLSPFYPSELADGGYDVADYRDVDPRLGTLADFDTLVAAAHRSGIRVMVDIVPNHSSRLHPWFQEALAAGRGSRERERYVFREGRGPNGDEPPTDWLSCFGGPAWTRVADGSWYLHLFASEQPDFNWDNPEVRQDFLRTLRFWCDRGVDGFRVDVAHGLAKDLTEPLRDVGAVERYTAETLPTDGSHPFWDRDEVHDIFREWRRVFDAYAPPRIAVAEAWVRNSRRSLYASREGLGQAFNFDFLDSPLDAAALRSSIDTALRGARAAGTTATWVLSNHDVIRHASRYAIPPGTDRETWLLSGGREPELDRAEGVQKALAATLLMLALPGSAYLYQGEELGLPEVADLAEEDLRDPVWTRSGGRVKGRDGCRVPLPWTRDGSSYGFGPNGSWLPQPKGWGALSVEAQEGRPDSPLELYRAALRLRRELVGDESLTWADDGAEPPGLLHFRRSGGWHCVSNLSDAPAPLPAGELLLASTHSGPHVLPPWTTAWLLREE
ncbi:glycoside hydrolase family 13 protein [Streptomyces durbertensis]|uniref:Glycoside hydrolase family 13 protein n=1 Tax=Streptomyces durbertensis TaxID=2448886 RepID=A0ABR6ELA5_9ACTN|nr:glycoside hydrolase family 13 protein [Streptomyces durbertensis]MBB1246087.1 glycoside hydrolase family 13 protein [Streptomyces durbertensis]